MTTQDLILIRNAGLRIIDRKFRKLLTAFAKLNNTPSTDAELARVYGGTLKALRDDIKNYALTCHRHCIGGHFEGRGGCELTGMHRVCSIAINQRQRLLWLEHDFADEAMENVTTEHVDAVQLAEERRSQNKNI